MTTTGFSSERLHIDAVKVAEQISASIRDTVLSNLRRHGVVLGLSGGVDSSVVAALCVKALGPDRVFGVFMPERDSESESLHLGRVVAGQLGIATVLEDITPTLDAMGCYRRRDEFVRQVFPEYGDDWKCKIVLTGAVRRL